MFSVAVSACDNEVFTSPVSARSRWSVTNDDNTPSSASSIEGIFHRAMSRRRTLEEDQDECFCEVSPMEVSRMSEESPDLSKDSDIDKNVSAVDSSCDTACSRWKSPALCSDEQTFNKMKKSTSVGGYNDTIVEVVAIDQYGVSKLELRNSSHFRHDPYKLRCTRRIKSADDKAEKITVYPGNQKISEISLPDWQEKPAHIHIPEPPISEPRISVPREEVPVTAAPSPSSESEYSDLISGCEISVGRSECMTLSNASDEVVGVETSLGPSRPMTPEDDYDTYDRNLAPTSSHGRSDNQFERPKKKRSVKDVFKKGLFLSKKNKHKDVIPPSTGKEPIRSQETSRPLRPRVYHRQKSRLDMNEPIEDVFAGVQFATIDKKPTPRPASSDDNDIIEDPDVFILSTMLERQTNSLNKNSRQMAANDKLTYDDVLSSNGRPAESLDLT